MLTLALTDAKIDKLQVELSDTMESDGTEITGATMRLLVTTNSSAMPHLRLPELTLWDKNGLVLGGEVEKYPLRHPVHNVKLSFYERPAEWKLAPDAAEPVVSVVLTADMTKIKLYPEQNHLLVIEFNIKKAPCSDENFIWLMRFYRSERFLLSAEEIQVDGVDAIAA
jgi:hypothetical protein